MENISFLPYNKSDSEHRNVFTQLFSDYLDEVFVNKPDDNLPKHILPKIVNIIAEETEKHKEWLYLY